MRRASKGVGGAIITLLMAVGVFTAVGTTAQAQYRRDRYDDRYRHERNRDWRRDRNRNGVDDRYERGTVYDRNRNGVDDRYESRGGGYGGYGTYGGYDQAAANQGYQNGLNTGSRDAERGQSYNPQRSHYYKEARSQAFRDGFVQGYDEGFRRYAGYGNGTYRRRNSGSSIGDILGGIFGRP